MPYKDIRKRNGRVYDDPADCRHARLANLRPGGGRKKRGEGEPVLPPWRLRIARQRAHEAVADAVSRAMRGVGHRQLSRRLGRDMGQTLCRIYRESDVTLSTLADIALATGHELVIELRPAAARRSAA